MEPLKYKTMSDYYTEFPAKLKQLVHEFNSLKLIGKRFIGNDFKIKATGENHFGDVFICLNVSRIDANTLVDISNFASKYNGSFGIHPVKGNDSLAIRISYK